MSPESIFIRQLIKSEEQDQTQIWLVCECKRVKVSTVQFEKGRVGNDSGPLHSPWLSQHLWEGNLEGCYWNESQEGPILKATHIETDSAESDKCSSDQI